MIKVFKILTFLFLLIFTSNVFWATEVKCEVNYWPSPKVKDYLRDLSFILWKIRYVWGVNNCGDWIIPKNVESKADVIIQDMNSLLTIGWYWSSWEFNLYPILFGAMPDAFYRDHDYLDHQIDAINNTTTYIAKNCNMDLKITNSDLISRVNKYWLSMGTLWELTSSLRKINTSIVVYFRCITVWSLDFSECKIDNSTIPFIKELEDDMRKNYWKDWMQACVKEQKKDELTLSLIGKILVSPHGFSSYDKVFKSWREALDLLYWVITFNTNEKQERSILRKELRRQWLSSSQADSVVKQLDCFNAWSVGCYLEHLTWFSQAKNTLLAAWENLSIKDSPTTNEIPRKRNNIAFWDDIATEIWEEYSFQSSIIKGEDKSYERWIANLIILHKNLIDINEEMISSFDASRKACNSQAKGVGNCN